MSALEIALAIAPGLAFCLLIYALDRWEKEPLGWLIGSFLAGAAATIPAIWLELSGFELFGASASLFDVVFLAFVAIALNEELWKWAILRLGPYERPFFNEPLDGIVFSMMIGMGFATAENLIYVERFGPETAFLRAFTAVPAHAAFAIFAGYFVGSAKFETGAKKRSRLLLRGFGLTVAAHGAYDFLIVQKFVEGLVALAMFFLAACLWQSSRLIRSHQDSSPFRPPSDGVSEP